MCVYIWSNEEHEARKHSWHFALIFKEQGRRMSKRCKKNVFRKKDNMGPTRVMVLWYTPCMHVANKKHAWYLWYYGNGMVFRDIYTMVYVWYGGDCIIFICFGVGAWWGPHVTPWFCFSSLLKVWCNGPTKIRSRIVVWLVRKCWGF